ncbi:type VI secretion system lipoprotein TssJ [Enterobacteriaceae bacterium C23F]
MKRKAAQYGLNLILALMLAACSTRNEPQTTPKKVEMTFHASKNSNPDRDGRAAPVQVMLYSLVNADNFANSDFISLTNGADPALLNDIKNQQQLILKPGESRTIKLEPSGDVHFFGIAAAFRTINDARWNAVYALHPQNSRPWYHWLIPSKDEPLKLEVALDNVSVSIKEAN